MTVVAAFKIGTMPVIIGDLLVTSDIKGAATPIQMPASGVPNVDYLLEYELSTLVQKVTQITDNLLVAWSGNFDEARKFVSTLRADVGALPKVSWRRVKRGAQ